MSKETEILSRLAANHLHLAQFEPFRAVLLALRTRNRDVARRILQTVVARSGRFRNILWSSSCPSPALFTYLSTLELLQFDNASSPWRFDPETLRMRAEFLLLVQDLIDLVPEASAEEEGVRNDDDDELGRCRKVLDGIMEFGVKRLEVDGDDVERSESWVTSGSATVEEGELIGLKKLVLEHATVFYALCENAYRQIKKWECEDRGLSVIVKGGEEGGGVVVEEEESEEGDVRVLGGILRIAQIVHLDAMKESLKASDTEGAVAHVRFLHFDHGVEPSEYRYVHLDAFVAKNGADYE